MDKLLSLARPRPRLPMLWQTARRLIIGGLSATALFLGHPPPVVHAATVTDLAGRTVTVPDNVQRILLGEGRLIYTLSLLEGQTPFARLAGWQGDFRMLDVQGYDTYAKRFPQAANIPLVGGASSETFSVEKALSVHPDIAIMALSGGHGPAPGSEAVRQLEAAGVPVIFVDFSLHPLTNTVPSITLLGRALGREMQAKAFTDFYSAQIARVTSVLAKTPPATRKPPTVFMDLLAGLQDCCGSPGRGNFGEMIALVGGQNIGSNRIPGAIGTLNREYILAQDPDVYIATGVFAAGHGGVSLGFAATAEEARRSLRDVAHRAQTRDLSAVRAGRVYGLWHIFYDSPEHFLAVQALAKWLHPDQFRGLDPEATRAEFYRRFMPIPLTGTLFIGQPGAANSGERS